MQEPNKKQYWIEKLDLKPHPEGGFYAEVFRSATMVEVRQDVRSASTSIYYLLGEGDKSVFHRLSSDETWYFHDGDPIRLIVLSEEGKLVYYFLGNQPGEKIVPQITIPADTWFAARSTGSYSLAGCHVAPGFEFTDFELAKRDELMKLYPGYDKIILEFTPQ
ncbi:MAG: cupin domain-containing protein [bacterium]